MSDLTQSTGPSHVADDDDPMQTNQIVDEAVTVQDEARSVEAIAQSYEDHVSQYTAELAKTLETTLQGYEDEVAKWQAEMDKSEAGLAFPAPNGSDSSDNTHSIIEHIEALKHRLAGLGDDDEGYDSDADNDGGNNGGGDPTKDKS